MSVTITLTDEQVAQVIAGAGGSTPVPTPPPVPAPIPSPTTASDGSKLVFMGTLQDLDGVLHQGTLTSKNTIYWAVKAPQSGTFSITHLQTNDSVNNTPCLATISKTPGDVGTGQWMSPQVAGGVATIRPVVGSKSGVVYGSRGNFQGVNMLPGETWYIMFQCRDFGKSNGNCTVKLQA